MFSCDPSFRTGLDITDSSTARKLSPGTANERRRSTLGSARTVVNVKDFGARGDGSSDDTKAFAAAWKAACSSSALVTVLVPEGKAYRLKPITFSGPCKSPITVAIKGTILASGRISDWDGADRRLWMLFDKVDGLRVEGGGTIDGNGQVWWKVSCKVDPAQEVQLITASGASAATSTWPNTAPSSRRRAPPDGLKRRSYSCIRSTSVPALVHSATSPTPLEERGEEDEEEDLYADNNSRPAPH
ncbi:unnamed protein product [Spirodela intermedia]|uniref:Uncharacterized protein n=2 Tax=Spirodela intermedia TaxID=51605 RepID=A0A7I8I7P7_SPIIN|nr:unnamed protein product [Spirodela intermedia]CAA6653635.1 unnamed protein product [Spirodela intermedia]CAA7387939.1 unnamed protein product [Spirodela intermedia]